MQPLSRNMEDPIQINVTAMITHNDRECKKDNTSRSHSAEKGPELHPKSFREFVDLGVSLFTGALALGDGRNLTAQQCFVSALDCPTDNQADYATAYYNMGMTMRPGESVKLTSGAVVTKQQCFVNALHHNPRMTYAYLNLALLVPDGETVTLRDGTVLTQRQCHMRAVEYVPLRDQAYVFLGDVICGQGTLTLDDGTVLTKKGCYTKAIECNPDNAMALYKLSRIMESGESVEMSNGTQLSKFKIVSRFYKLQEAKRKKERSLPRPVIKTGKYF